MTERRTPRFGGARSSTGARLALTIMAIFMFPSCGGGGSAGGGSGGGAPGAPTIFSNYHLTGLITPVRDPSIALQNGTYYVFSTDAGLPGPQSLPILCSTDRLAWKQCGAVFQQIPPW